MTTYGIWELENHIEISEKITDFFQSTPEVDLYEAVVFGSYGNGTAETETSDLDILLGVSTSGVFSQTEQKRFYESLAEELVWETDLTERLSISPTVDLMIVEQNEVKERLIQYAHYSNNYNYYDLLKHKQKEIQSHQQT